MRLCELRVCANGLLPTTASISDIFSSVPHLGDVGNPHKLHPILEGPGKRSGAGGGVGAGGGGTHTLNQSFPCAATPLRLPGSPRAEREERKCDRINHGPWERWHSLEAQECKRITPEEEEEEDNEVPETMGGQRRMCVDITGASSVALINRHQPLSCNIRTNACA